MQIPELIERIRVDNGLTQKELASLLGVSNRAVSKWETGISSPTAENLLSMIIMFKTTFDAMRASGGEAPRPKRNAAGMTSVREVYKIGRGPSSSHTMGPERIVARFKEKYPQADAFRVTLFGSLALTGMGHGTRKIVEETMAPISTEVTFDMLEKNIEHQNTMDLYAYRDGELLGSDRAYSIGGGSIQFRGEDPSPMDAVYTKTSFEEIHALCKERQMRIWEYVEQCEDANIGGDLLHVWQEMKECIRRGLEAGGTLPGGLGVARKARHLYSQHHIDESFETRDHRKICAYAYAVSEENAAGERVVTAPTCGAAGVVPAVLYHYQKERGFSDSDIVHALETGGLIGNLISHNASVSGAECGCQAEVGSACAMAAACLGELLGMTLDQIEYAAEIAIEHHLGLTCDPVCGLVQIPCIERNAVAAMRAINAVILANFLSDTRKISLDRVIRTMYETGIDMASGYKETSQAGLAKLRL